MKIKKIKFLLLLAVFIILLAYIFVIPNEKTVPVALVVLIVFLAGRIY